MGTSPLLLSLHFLGFKSNDSLLSELALVVWQQPTIFNNNLPFDGSGISGSSWYKSQIQATNLFNLWLFFSNPRNGKIYLCLFLSLRKNRFSAYGWEQSFVKWFMNGWEFPPALISYTCSIMSSVFHILHAKQMCNWKSIVTFNHLIWWHGRSWSHLNPLVFFKSVPLKISQSHWFHLSLIFYAPFGA